MTNQANGFYEFDSFRVDVKKRLLLRDGEPVLLKPKAFETLLLLVQNSGRVVEKGEMMEALWPETFVEESSLTQHISLVRKALGEKAGEHRFIVTETGRGYRFVADVREVRGEPPAREAPAVSRTGAEGNEAKAEQSIQRLAGDVPPSAPVVSTPARKLRLTPQAVAVVLLSCGLTAVLVLFWLKREPRQPSAETAPVKSIAVLPFRTLSTGEGEEYLGVGLTDTLISRFTSLRQVNVRPMSAVLKYGAAGQDAAAAGRELKVDAVLDGVVQRTGDRVRVTARLLRVSDGTPLWAQTFDERWTDIFTVQDTISGQVSESLALNLTGEDKQRLAKRDTENAEAYSLYLQATYLVEKRTKASLEKSMELFQHALDLDPNFARAYWGMSQAYAQGYNQSLSPRERGRRRKGLTLKALEIDETLGPAHATLASTKWRMELDWAGAEESYKLAVKLSPGEASVHQRYGGFLVAQGRFEDGIAHLRRAYELDPIGTVYTLGLTGYGYARRYDDAVEQLRKFSEIEPNSSPAYSGLGWVYVLKGNYAEGIELLEKAAKLEEITSANVLGELGKAYALAGRRADAVRVLGELDALQKQGRGSWGAKAIVHAALGEKDEAFACLDKAVDEHEWWVFFFKVHPDFDGLRADPRFDALIRRTGLTP